MPISHGPETWAGAPLAISQPRARVRKDPALMGPPQSRAILFKGNPNTLSALAPGLRYTWPVGLYSTGSWQLAWIRLFRRTGRVYVALDRDATDRAIALARTFGTRGRVLIPPARWAVAPLLANLRSRGRWNFLSSLAMK
jgi:hypothetical protein